MSAPIGDREYAYSRCEACGTDNDPVFTDGEVATSDHNWSTYVCGGPGRGSGADGCGRNWSVTTAAGIVHNASRGHETIGRLPRDVSSGRFISAPSEAYQRGWELIFGTKGRGNGQDESHDG
jgi:hypothetical protein